MRTTLRDALEIWRERSEPSDHPTMDELYAVAVSGRLDTSILNHVAACGRCARDLGDLAESIDEAVGLDLALPKAAAAPVSSPVSLVTVCGKYTIGVYPRGDDKAMVTVEVMPPFATELEGRTVTLTDRAGTVLLSAPIVLGRASGRVALLHTLDLTRLVMRTAPGSAEGTQT